MRFRSWIAWLVALLSAGCRAEADLTIEVARASVNDTMQFQICPSSAPCSNQQTQVFAGTSATTRTVGVYLNGDVATGEVFLTLTYQDVVAPRCTFSFSVQFGVVDRIHVDMPARCELMLSHDCPAAACTQPQRRAELP